MTLIVCENPNLSLKLRRTLAEHGHECPSMNVLTFDAASDNLQTMQTEPDLILLAIRPDCDRWEGVLKFLRTFQKARIIAIGPRDPNLILAAVHGGADDFVDESANLTQEVTDALSRVVSSGSRLTTAGHVVTVLSGSGGTGCTTVASNLAVVLAKRHGSTAYLDLDRFGGNAAAFFNMSPKHTIADLFRNSDKLDQNMLGQSLLQHESGIQLLPAPLSHEDAQLVTADGIVRVLRLARGMFAHVVVDVNDFHHECHRQLLQQSSAVLIVSRLDFASVNNTAKTLKFMERIGIDRRRMHLIVNRFGQSNEIPLQKAESALKMTALSRLPEDAKSVNLATNCGNPCVLEAPKSKFSVAVSTLAGGIAAALGSTSAAVQPDAHAHNGLPLPAVSHFAKHSTVVGLCATG